ncbi:MAG TPA: BlaI/MecI/CopY family transcriptional regulator [Longimicrobiaceae bacterium]|jgi:predicted transcriptional regulator|nr:BlaI/MecI/CopY family transcriptional regulator [Longimicrobiaceae bacterium]
MPESPHLTDLQLAILRVFWERGEAGVADVFRALWDERHLAQSTVATVISRLEKRGLLARRGDARQYFYRATVTEEEVRRAMVDGLTSLLFRGDAAALVSHLVQSRELAPGDLERVRALLDSLGDEENDGGAR